jgi:hypothetical protein
MIDAFTGAYKPTEILILCLCPRATSSAGLDSHATTLGALVNIAKLSINN